MIKSRHVPTSRAAACAAALLLAILVPAACTSPGPSSSDDGTVSILSTALSESLAYLPSDTSYLTVTDWGAIKTAAGHKSATSESSNAERHQTYTDIFAHQATASHFASDTITFDLGSTIGSPPPEGPSAQAREWGFDALDLRWDASVFEPKAVDGVMLLRLRPGIDMGALSARFDQRGFASEQVNGITVRDLGGATYAPSKTSIEPAMSNTAFLPDGRTLAISTSLDELKLYLGLMKTGAPAAITNAAAALNNPWVSAMLAGSPACGYFNPPAGWTLDTSFAAGVERQIKGVGALGTFQAVAIGYSGTHSPVSRIAFVYPDAASAKADLGGRRILADQAYRLAPDHRTYATSVFTVDSAEVVDTDLDLDVTPVKDQPIQLFEAFAGRDLVPAVCGA